MSLFLTCTEIVLYIYSDLSPKIYVSSALMKAVSWTAVLVLDCVALGSDWEKGQWNDYLLFVVIGFAGAVYIVLIVGVIYGVVVFLRARRTVSDNVEKVMRNSSEGSVYSGPALAY